MGSHAKIVRYWIQSSWNCSDEFNFCWYGKIIFWSLFNLLVGIGTASYGLVRVFNRKQELKSLALKPEISQASSPPADLSIPKR